jgi:membrane associated rhomboid family serine protease
MTIPLSFGYLLISDLFLRIDENNLKKVTILNMVLFLVMIGLLIIAAYCRIDEKSFFGMAYAGGIFSYILGLAIVGIGLRKRWEDKKKLEKKYLY